MSMQSTQAFVFASDTSQGNEARVVIHDSGQISAVDMQSFAAQQAVPVVAFLERQPQDWRVRFFTRRMELPYCGHGVLAAARVALDKLRVDQAVLVAGSQRVAVRREGAQVTALTTRPAELTLESDPEAVKAYLNWADGPQILDPIWRGSIGSPKWLVS